MTDSQNGTKYVVGGRYNQFYVDMYINGQMHGTVIGGTTKKKATEAANALNSAYRAGLHDAALFIKEQYEKDNPTGHVHEPYCGCPAGTLDAHGNI